jgi:hypothetical protein
MASKIQREVYYAKILTKCCERHPIKNKKLILPKKIDWNKLNNYVNKN